MLTVSTLGCDLRGIMKICVKCQCREAHTKSYCKPCAAIVQKEHYHNSEARRGAIKQRRDKVKVSNKKFINRYKSFCGCRHCGEKDYVVLDLHHINPSEKEAAPALLIGCSRETIKLEIRKCIVLCANCHRREHHRLRLV